MDIIFVVQADNGVDNNILINAVFLEVYAESETNAIEKVKEYIKRDNYKVTRIIEKKEC